MSDPGLRAGAYVHIPFCESKCSYCHFAIDPRRPDADRQQRYLDALLVEIAGTDAVRADTLYLGGGTPSLFSVERLARLVEVLRDHHRLDEACELSIEANPRDLDRDGYRALVELGFNRLSLGVQSLEETVLEEMGRQHTPADAHAAVALAREAGMASVSVDLILGWPGETAERWGATLRGVADLRPDHVSVYLLEVSGKTLLAHRQRQGRLALPDDDLVASLYLVSIDRLSALGLEQYEISNFARPGHESRHNLKYWDDQQFLGYGMAAHGYLGARRYWNLPSYGGYCRGVELGGPAGARAGERVLSPRARPEEALFMALRCRAGIVLPEFARRYGVEVLEEYAEALRDAFEAGLIEVADERLRLTRAGMLLSNEVFKELV